MPSLTRHDRYSQGPDILFVDRYESVAIGLNLCCSKVPDLFSHILHFRGNIVIASSHMSEGVSGQDQYHHLIEEDGQIQR